MKKILTFLAIAVMAISVSASSVDWSYSGEITDKNNKSGVFSLSGNAWIIYMGSATDTSLITVDDSGNINYGSYTVEGNAGIEYGMFNMGSFVSTVTANNGNYIMVGAYQDSDGWYYGLTGIKPVSGLVNDDTAITKVDFGSDTWSLSTKAVPEPTTVALLALGLAALGMKRKVA